MTTSPAWTNWQQSDLPCRFSKQQAIENCAFLRRVLLEDWIDRHQSNQGPIRHSLMQMWSTCGANAFLELNGLAEDLKLLDHVEGFETVLDDLRDTDRCLPARHAIHSAALFERSQKNIVTRFFPQTDARVPDFLLTTPSGEIPVEAKRLETSQPERDFVDYAKNIWAELQASIMKEKISYPSVRIICKDASVLPGVSEVIEAVKHAVLDIKEFVIVVRSKRFNLYLEPLPGTVGPLHESKAVFIYCPKSEKEDLRIESRAKTASKQISAYDSSIRDGLVCLSLTEFQNPHYVKSLLEKRFAQNNFRGIARAMLLRSGTWLQPPERSLIDLIGIVPNRAKPPSERFNVGVRGAGYMAKLFDAVEPEQGIPAYRFAQVSRRITTDAGQGVFMPDVRLLTQEMLS